MYKILTLVLVFTSTLFAEHYLSHGKKQLLTRLNTSTPFVKSRSNQQAKVIYYKNASGERLGVENTLIVSFDDISIQLYIEKEFSLTLVKALSSEMFVYQISDKGQTLALANRLAEISGVEFAYPDFIVQKKSRTLDPLFDASWHLNTRRGINVEEAWKITKGRGVIVSVYDEGIDIEHEDLRDNILGYANFNNLDKYEAGHIDIVNGTTVRLNNYAHNAPAPASDIWHGTSCAGLIAASENDRGSVGVAPEAKLFAVRYASSNISRDIEAFYEMANKGSAVISNSWGTYNNIDEGFNKALKELAQKGRGGKGILVFFAAGNDGCDMDKYYSTYKDSTGKTQHRCESSSRFSPINDESESPYVISIAASTQYNTIANYSNFGSAIDFTAPGSGDPASIITTDAMGSKGAIQRTNDLTGNYTTMFSGTSAAAPIAAGTAALILSSNPTLSKEEVIEILKTTADKLGSTPYKDGRNDHWGYGRINAGAAVKLASQYGDIKIENFAHKIYKDMH